jgi:ubiquinone biosynthesis protein
MIRKKGPADIVWIEKKGLLAVKLAQIFALRPDIISVEKCRQLQGLYQHASMISAGNFRELIHERGPENFNSHFSWIDDQPLAAASVGQVHRAKLKTGEEVVIKVIKGKYADKFKRDVKRMKSWLKWWLMLSPKLRKVGNPIALLNHVSDYTTRELDLRNEIKGANELIEIRDSLKDNFPMPMLRFPKYYPELSNEHVLVSEYIDGKSLEELIESNELEWGKLLDLFRIHGAYLFGIGTFHGDLHPGNCFVDNSGNFVFIDNASICHAPDSVSRSLFEFFESLSNRKFDSAFKSLLGMSEKLPEKEKLDKYFERMYEIYCDFEEKTIGEQSLTQTMMQTVKAAVELAGAEFGEEAFPIIRALMYLDGLVARSHPDVKLVKSMGPYLKEFREGLGINTPIDA